MSMLVSFLPLLAGTAPVPAPPEIQREFRAAWVATVDNIDWPSKKNLDVSEQKAELLKIFDQARTLNLNAIILQVRPAADAFYGSPFEPWSEYLTGAQGKAPKPFYDPLQFAVDEAHKRGLELHCWFNPYRAQHPSQKSPLDPSHLAKTNPSVVKRYGRYLWMDPSEPAVQKRSLDVMLDVVKRYDVDGIHIDDYFYPYKEKGPDGKLVDFPDDPSWNRYRNSGGRLSRDDWRRKSVDDFIERLYQGIKREKQWVKFGISPFGIYRPNIPEGIKAGVDQYADLYADARKWLVEGWVDYYTPQLYWPVNQTPQSYPKLLDWWISQNPKGRHVWPGNFTSRTNPADGNWKSAEVLEQIEITRKRPGSTGNIHFSMKAMMKNWNGVTDALKKGPYRMPAVVPASPWLDQVAPRAPKVERKFDGQGWTISWNSDGDKDIRFYAVSIQDRDGKWSTPRITSSESMGLSAGATAPMYVAVTAIDRVGNMGKPTVERL